jgi:alpha/beta superfamily hydrolase
LEQEFTCITLHVKGNQTATGRYYRAENAKSAVIFVGGIEGGFDSPAKNLYPKLAAKLVNEGVSGLRIQFRYPTILTEAVLDVLAGAKFLQSQGIESLGLVGHSFGGAVVIQAGTVLQWVKTVVTLATQGYGTDEVAQLSTHASILLIHGDQDERLSPENSRLVYQLAEQPKELRILESNSHGLLESAEEVFMLVHDWLVKELRPNVDPLVSQPKEFI